MRELFENADSRELGLWIAKAKLDNEEAKLQGMVARAEAALAKKRGRR